MDEQDLGLMMKEFADDAAAFALDQYQTTLDYSDESIQSVERILGALYAELGQNDNDNRELENVDALCGMFGGYIGEVLRRQYGGYWKIETIASEQPMVCLQVKESYVFPLPKVFKRLSNGSSDDVWFYYEVIRQKLEAV